MRTFAKRNDVMCLKSAEDRRNRFDRNRGLCWLTQKGSSREDRETDHDEGTNVLWSHDGLEPECRRTFLRLAAIAAMPPRWSRGSHEGFLTVRATNGEVVMISGMKGWKDLSEYERKDIVEIFAKLTLQAYLHPPPSCRFCLRDDCPSLKDQGGVRPSDRCAGCLLMYHTNGDALRGPDDQHRR